MTKPFLSVERLTQKFPDGKGGETIVFEDATFGVEKGEFVCILGHSGCGKSTIMNILAGLAEPTSGVVKMDGFEVSGPSLDRGVVFQNYSLLPWLSALSNVTFGVRARHPEWSKAQVAEHSTKYLAMVGLEGDAIHRKPAQLSGGMRQRVSIARAFANHPKLLLLDEPFGALDALTRGTIQDELLKIWGGTQQTVFMITHDIDEAILLADRILLMTNGPRARVAESVEITIPRPRNRTDIVEHPNYYAIRNHLVQFLGRRSKELAGQASGGGPQSPETVRIDLSGDAPDSKPEDNPMLRAAAQ
ncbi:ABC transporter ATP-binding protein [Salipiger mangrovisoli]|uniref:ABC transporter ATP-binding protein n=1 Tax=Salipiger mangrovisoli TaxID=2865933 RepID=A0ABR9X9Q9_9RHOB|nr:ABC transporter ATP-binding protein [Salipiger mangrovisoli]MBE9640216.1 ABC transporter ATP-binding protein [Salipiger mangrovisoli]